MSKRKILLIRFSSIGDVTQCLSVPTRLKELAPEGEVHWVTRSDMASLIEGHPFVDRVWSLDRKSGFRGLWKLACELRKQKYTHIYDAHNNLRSSLLSMALRPPLDFSRVLFPPDFIRKSQKRFLRFLLFHLRINRYRMPWSGQRDLLEPLATWGLSEELPAPPQIFVPTSAIDKMISSYPELAKKDFVTLAPSAAFVLKRWPMSHWQSLISKNPDLKFVVLGGKEDQFLFSLEKDFPGQVLCLAGKTSVKESAAVVMMSKALVSNDTGVLHMGEQLGKPSIALMGPAPFGFPSRASTKILQLDLECRPCSKHGQGPCVNAIYHKCLVEISPDQVSEELGKILRQV